jgi:hypothetical protein
MGRELGAGTLMRTGHSRQKRPTASVKSYAADLKQSLPIAAFFCLKSPGFLTEARKIMARRRAVPVGPPRRGAGDQIRS